MFLDYRKAISNKPLKSIVHNPKVIEYFNKNAPSRTKYIPSVDGAIILFGNNMKIGGMQVVLTNEQKKIIGDNPPMNDVVEYIDNAQESVKLKPIKDGFIIVNGEEISIDRFQLMPFSDVIYQYGEFWLTPIPIQPFYIEIEGNGIKKRIKMRRVPMKSITKREFETVDSDPIKLSYIIDTVTLNFEFSYTYNLDRASSAKEIYDTYNFIYGVSIGNGKIGNIKLNNPLCTIEEKTHFEALVSVWRKISQIENKLNKRLVPPKNDTVNIETRLVEMLYQSIVYKQPIKRNFDVNSVEVTKKDNDINELYSLKGKPYFLSFNDDEKLSLFGIELIIPRIVFSSESIIDDIEDIENAYRIILLKTKSTLNGVIYFSSNQERSDYIKNMNPQYIIQNTKNIDELMSG